MEPSKEPKAGPSRAIDSDVPTEVDEVEDPRQDRARPDAWNLKYNMSDMLWEKVDTDEERIPRKIRPNSSSSSSDSDLGPSDATITLSDSSRGASSNDNESSPESASDSDVKVVMKKSTENTPRRRKRKRRINVSDLDSSFASLNDSRNLSKEGSNDGNESQSYSSHLSIMWCLGGFERGGFERGESSSLPSEDQISLENRGISGLRRDDPTPGTSRASASNSNAPKRKRRCRKVQHKRKKKKRVKKFCGSRKMAGSKGKCSKNRDDYRRILKGIEVESSPEAYRGRDDEALDRKEEAVARAIEKYGDLRHCKEWRMYLLKNPREDEDPWVALPLDRYRL